MLLPVVSSLPYSLFIIGLSLISLRLFIMDNSKVVNEVERSINYFNLLSCGFMLSFNSFNQEFKCE